MNEEIRFEPLETRITAITEEWLMYNQGEAVELAEE